MEAKTLLFALLRHAVCGEKLNTEIVSACTTENLEAVYVLAQKHDLAHLVAHAIERLNLPESEVLAKLKKAKVMAIYRYAKLDYEFVRICNVLEDAGIPFIPLKGSVLRRYYPEPWMRISCDIDVLVPNVQLDEAIRVLTENDWELREKWSHHDVKLFSAGGIRLELHYQLTQNMPQVDSVLERVWEYAEPMEGKQFEYRMSDAFFVLHHLTHMSYHFITGGCGIRPVLDLRIMQNKISLDNEACCVLLKAARLESFYESVIELMHVWFADKPHSVLSRKMENYVVFGGIYGNLSNKVLVSQARAGGSNSNLFQRIIQPYDKLSLYYPVLKRYRFLTPLFQVVRWLRVLRTGRFRHSIQELKINKSNSKYKIDDAKGFLAELGLLDT